MHLFIYIIYIYAYICIYVYICTCIYSYICVHVQKDTVYVTSCNPLMYSVSVIYKYIHISLQLSRLSSSLPPVFLPLRACQHTYATPCM